MVKSINAAWEAYSNEDHTLLEYVAYMNGWLDAEKWVPVSESLPEAGGMYLVVIDSGSVNKETDVSLCRWRLRLHHGFEWGCEADWGRVTHWRELPEKPSEETQG